MWKKCSQFFAHITGLQHTRKFINVLQFLKICHYILPHLVHFITQLWCRLFSYIAWQRLIGYQFSLFHCKLNLLIVVLKMKLASKVVKIDLKITISQPWSKSVKLAVALFSHRVSNPPPRIMVKVWALLHPYSVFQGFSKAKFAKLGSILSLSQFSILPQLAQKMKLTSKVVKIDPKIIISLPKI